MTEFPKPDDPANGYTAVYDAFNVQRHLIRRSILRLFRTEARRRWAMAIAAV